MPPAGVAGDLFCQGGQDDMADLPLAAVAAPSPTADCWAFDGLLFDMGDVLYDATLWRRWLWRLLRSLGVGLSYHELFAIWDDNHLDAVHRGQGDYAAAFQEFLTALRLTCGQRDEVVAASRIRKRELESEARPMAGVKATIDRLVFAKIPLAVVSDSESPAEKLREHLDRLGFAGAFQTIVSSRDLGCTKPDPRCYLAALSELNLAPHRAAFVGHDAVELAGARAVGLASIAFNETPGCEANIRLGHFRELLCYVRPHSNLAKAG
jgi:HAD superfamily hydrolase (TIGR01509 family)